MKSCKTIIIVVKCIPRTVPSTRAQSNRRHFDVKISPIFILDQIVRK